MIFRAQTGGGQDVLVDLASVKAELGTETRPAVQASWIDGHTAIHVVIRYPDSRTLTLLVRCGNIDIDNQPAVPEDARELLAFLDHYAELTGENPTFRTHRDRGNYVH